MRNITPSGSMARKKRRFTVTGMMLLFAALVLLAVMALLIIVPMSIAPWYQTVIFVVGGAGVFVGAFGLFNVLRGWRYPLDNPYAAKTAEFLERFLDYRYTYIRNISRRSLGYVDAVLVGPNGVLVFYFFKGMGTFHTEHHVWFQQVNGQLRLLSENPTQEAVKDVQALRKYMEAQHLGHVPVFALVVVAYNNSPVSIESPVIPVAYMPGIQTALADNYLSHERISPEHAAQAVQAILDGLV